MHNKEEVKAFIEKHAEILDYIEEITPLIDDYFPKYSKIIEFCKDPEFDRLDFVMIYIKGESFEKDYETLNRFKEEPLYISKFSRNIKGLVCVELL
ncbi:MAG: hypothetical protein Q4Q18_00170 [Methanobrevibacter sp.]|nr:hypothetical protein [Methanobrevibacter sp.]